MALSNVLDWLGSLPEPALLAGAGALVIGEGVVGLGFVIPGEAALLIAAAAVGSIPEFLILWAVTTTCSVIGNVIGFELGRRVGPPLRDVRFIQKHGGDRWDRASELLQRHGSKAVFIGRVIPFVRNVVPAVAGAAGIPYRMFLAAVTAGAACATVLPILFVIVVTEGVRQNGNLVVAAAVALVAAGVIGTARKRRTKRLTAAGPLDGVGDAMSRQADLAE